MNDHSEVETGTLATKLDRSFLHLDVDRNGQIEREDLLGLGARLLLTFAEPTSTPKGQALLAAFDRFWDTLADHCDSDRDGHISPAEYRTGMLAAFVAGDRYEAIFQPAAGALAIVADTDGDGRIDRAEFLAMEAALGVAEADADHAFTRLSTHGHLDVRKYFDAVRDYYTSPDPQAPGNWLYGPAFHVPPSPALP